LFFFLIEKGNNDEDQDRRRTGKKSTLKFVPESEIREEESWKGYATNTGPKGVIKDWQRFKQLESQKDQEAVAEKRALAKKLSMTCKSADLDEHLDNKKPVVVEEEEQDLMEDEFFQEYIKKKFMEMTKKLNDLPKFGEVIELTGETFLSEIDNENKNVKILIHIYDQKISECRLMNQCLDMICKDYLVVKFCKIKSVEINLSEKFVSGGHFFQFL